MVSAFSRKRSEIRNKPGRFGRALKGSAFEVDDHPFDRGYFDCVVIGLGLRYEQYEETKTDREAYEAGYQAALEELRSESG